jgi:hypothetical protein
MRTARLEVSEPTAGVIFMEGGNFLDSNFRVVALTMQAHSRGDGQWQSRRSI